MNSKIKKAEPHAFAALPYETWRNYIQTERSTCEVCETGRSNPIHQPFEPEALLAAAEQKLARAIEALNAILAALDAWKAPTEHLVEEELARNRPSKAAVTADIDSDRLRDVGRGDTTATSTVTTIAS